MTISQLFLAVFALLLLSFKTDKAEQKIQPGSYGICGCDEANPSSAKFVLTLNEDQTFKYVNNISGALINITGTYVYKNNFIELVAAENGTLIHDKWKADKDPKCIKSRLGLEFSRLCLTAACK